MSHMNAGLPGKLGLHEIQHIALWDHSGSGFVMLVPCAPQGKLTAQGKLLQQDTFYVTEQDSGVQSRPKERRVFLFEQIVIFSELLRKGSLTPGYMFKKSIKVRNAEGEAYSV